MDFLERLRERTFIIAEAGVNHNGDVGLARKLVEAAAEAGADAVKFQTFKADRLATRGAPKADYQRDTTDAAESQWEMLRRLELSPEAHRDLMVWCQKQGILFLSSLFDEESADFLADLGVTLFKIPSGEITNLPLLAHVARKGKPMIVSTGMSYLSEVEAAVRAIEDACNRQIVLLHCVSRYPADPADANLRAMEAMAQAFHLPVGYSDHTLGLEVPLAAVALGARVIEKHLTLDRSLPGPDHRISLSTEEFRALTQAIRKVEQALGDGRKRPMACEVDVREAARRSIVAVCDIPAGATIEARMLALRRPGTGLPPHLLPQLINRTARRRIEAGEVLGWDMLE